MGKQFTHNDKNKCNAFVVTIVYLIDSHSTLSFICRIIIYRICACNEK